MSPMTANAAMSNLPQWRLPEEVRGFPQRDPIASHLYRIRCRTPATSPLPTSSTIRLLLVEPTRKLSGDVADGEDTGGSNPEGCFSDGTAANGNPAGETDNTNADSLGGTGSTKTAEASESGKSGSAPGQNN